MSEKIKEEIVEEKVCACENCTCEEDYMSDYIEPNYDWSDLDTCITDTEHLVIQGNKEQKIALYTALNSFYGEVTNPENTKVNKMFSGAPVMYAPLDEVLNTIRPILAKYGLFVTQSPTFEEDMVAIQTVIFHSAGAVMSYPKFKGITKGSNPIHAIGSVVTYLRRFALNSIFGIAGEPDDDGNGDTKKPASKKEPTTSKVKQLTQAIMAKIKANKELQPAIGEIIKQYTTDGSAIKENIPEEKIDEVILKLKELK